VELVSLTGLRVEEALRLKWGEVTIRIRPTIDGKVVSRSEITIPGTKTKGAQATIAIALLPALLLRRMSEETSAGPHEAVFPISYRSLERTWEYARLYLGVQENHMATLKALRRTAARHLTVNGMPTEMVRAYLRHSNIQTTMGYLALVGGYSTEEQHRWLD
jgi:integrase